jgi:putative DNA methylase
MTYFKELIEGALPLKAINESSAIEKSMHQGHPAVPHLWWARWPPAACRVVSVNHEEHLGLEQRSEPC